MNPNILDTKNREIGYYWIRINICSPYEIALWNGCYWKIFNSTKKWDDDDFEIIEEPIFCKH